MLLLLLLTPAAGSAPTPTASCAPTAACDTGISNTQSQCQVVKHLQNNCRLWLHTLNATIVMDSFSPNGALPAVA